MTIRHFIQGLDGNTTGILIVLVVLTLLPLVLRGLHGKGRGLEKPWRYFYSVVVYAASIPGVFAALLTSYTLFFTRENLLDQSITLYFAPIVAMFVTLTLISKFVSLKQVPGFDRITGLIALLGITGIVILLLSRLNFFVGFFGNFTMMIAVGAFLFLLIKWGAGRVFRGPGEEKEEPPTFGG